jgi:hypothetical protein
MDNVEFSPYGEIFCNPYQEFANREWGDRCYQSSLNYIDWLYKENPCGGTLENDFLLGLHNGSVVACIHKMRLNWSVHGEIKTIPALHNLMVTEKFRHGLGFAFLMRSVMGEDHALIPGVAHYLAEAYRKLKYQQVNTCWYRKVLTPIKGGLLLGLKKFFDYNGKARYFSSSDLSGMQNDSFRLSLDPSEEIVGSLVSLLNQQPGDRVFPHWSVEQFKWRFFHPLGPRHLLIYRPSRDGIKDFIIVSLGPRNGLNVGRIVEMETSSEDHLKTLLQEAERVLKKFGGHLLLIFSSDARLNGMLQQLAYQPIKNSPETFFYHKKRKELFNIPTLNGSAGDLGFEALPSVP